MHRDLSDHRMCVIAKETGLSPWARTRGRTWSFRRRRPRLSAAVSLGYGLFAAKKKNLDSKEWAMVVPFKTAVLDVRAPKAQPEAV